ncbi:MAG: hypothetical protein RLZZ582_90, partial [Verrucomicrobiota bacterium]
RYSTTSSARSLIVTGSATQTVFPAISGSVSGTDPDPTTTLMYGIQGGAATATAGQVAQTGSFGTLTLNTATGAYSFAPSAAGINPLQFSASEAYTLTVSDGVATASVELTIQVNVPPPTQLAITTQPSGVVSGVLINPSTVVEIRDSQGNRTANTGAVTVSIDSGTGGALSGALTVNAVNGVATFANLTMTGVLNSAYRLKFSSGYKAASTGGQVEWANVVRNGRGTGRSLLSIDLRQFTGSGINPNQVETIQLLDLYSGPATWIGSDPYWAQFEIQSALSNVATSPYARLTFAGGETYSIRADFTFAPLCISAFSAVFSVQMPPTLAAIGVAGTEDIPLTFSSGLFSPFYTDPEGAAMSSIQIVSLPETGVLSLAGSAVSAAQVIPVAQLGSLTYTPAANQQGSRTFSVKASDGSAWSGEATVTMTLASVNDSPVAGNATLTSIAEDVALADNPGTSVLVLANAGSDGDAGALKGIAITSIDASNGSWQYTINGGGSWSSLSGVSSASARLLKGDELHRVRFLPNPDFNGTATIQYRAWDQVSGVDASLVDVTSIDGRAWALVAYGADASLGGFLNAASGTFSSVVRSGSAVLPALSLLKSSSELALSWTVAGGGFPVGGIASYNHAVAFALPNASGMSFDGSATSPPIFSQGNLLNSFAVGSTHADQSLVTVRTLTGAPNMPTQMYLRNKSFGAGYGGVYGLVVNNGSNPQLDYGQFPDNQTFKALYLDHGTGNEKKTGLVMGGAGGAQNSYVPSSMALWARLSAVQVLALAGSQVGGSGHYPLVNIGTTYLDIDASASYSLNAATATLTVTPVNDAPQVTISGSDAAILNASTLKASTGATADGVYSLFFNGASVPVYCLMNDALGGGWMLAMKGANTGSTFNYSSSYWTTANTLNTAATRRNDTFNEDAKFEVFNSMPASEILVIFPEATAGGAITGQSYGFVWRESMPTPANTTAYTGRPTQGNYTGKTLRELFAGGEKIFIRDAVATTPYRAAGAGVFSAQTDVRFFGFNYVSTVGNNRVRFGFGWNENGGGLFPNGNEGSNDVSGGLGMDRVNWSAGDYIGCCQNSTGLNRPLKFEVYVRGPTSASMLTEDVAGNVIFESPLIQDADSASLTVTLSASDGVITGNPGTGITIGGSSIARTFVGSVANLNSYFATVGNVTYLGAANNSSDRTLTVSAFDGTSTVSASRVLRFVPVNDAPVATGQTVTTLEDTAKLITLAGTDVEGATLTYAVVTPPTKGVLSGTPPNLTYTPNANANGSDSFTFKANDGAADSLVATVSVSITPVNDVPVATAQTVTTDEDTAKPITLWGTDVEGSALTYSVVAQPTRGVLSGTAPNLTYIPNANVHGSDAFTFKVNDGAVDSEVATVSITITPVNDAPTLSMMMTATGGVLTTASGSVIHTFTANGTFTPNYSGMVEVLVVGGGGSGGGSTAGGGGGGGLIYNSAYAVTSGAAITVTVGAGGAQVPNQTAGNNGADSVFGNLRAIGGGGGGATSASSAFAAKNGGSGGGGGQYNGRLAAAGRGTAGQGNDGGPSGSDNFPGGGGGGAGAVGGSPASNKSGNGGAGVGYDISGATVFYAGGGGGGSSVSGGSGGIGGGGAGTSNGGAGTAGAANTGGGGGGGWLYASGTGGSGGSGIVIVRYPSSAISFADTAVNDTFASVSRILVGADVDAGSTLTYGISGVAAMNGIATKTGTYGTLAVTTATGDYTFTPNAAAINVLNASTTETWAVTVSDGLATTVVNLVIQLTGVNDAPVATAQTVTTDEDTAKPITLSGTDVEGSALTYAVVTQPTKGVLSGTAPNLTYTPNANVNGSDSFTFRVNDGAVNSGAATVSISITAVNDAPVATAQTVTTDEDTARLITLSGTDVEGSALTYAVVTQPTKGVLSGTAPNLTYTPNANVNGSDSFTFQVNDGAV